MIIASAFAISIASSLATIKLVDIKDKEAFKKGDIVESPANERPGFYVFRDSKFHSNTLNKALDVLRKVDIPYLFQKKPDGKIVAWKIDGQLEKLKQDDVPTNLFRELKTGKTVLKLQQTSVNLPMGLPRFNMLVNVSTDLNPDNLAPQKLTTWLSLGESKLPFMRVFFRMHVPLGVGALRPKSGAEKTIDGVRFRISTGKHFHSSGSPIDESKILSCDMLVDQMTDGKASPSQTYALGLKIDRERYKMDFPKDESKEIAYCSSSRTPGTPYAVRFYIHSNRPTKYWKDISVTQSSFLEGYMGHIPTAPNTH